MAVEISSRKELEAWLEGKRIAWSNITALRNALRVLPIALDPQSYSADPIEAGLVMSVFRALAVSACGPKIQAAHYTRADHAGGRGREYAAFVANSIMVRDASIFAYSDATVYFTSDGDAGAGAVANAAGSAAVVAAHCGGRTSFDSIGSVARAKADDACSYVTARAAHAASGNKDSFAIWREVSHDCEALTRSADINALLASPLWSIEPSWFGETWARVDFELSASPAGFALWRDWYERKLRGERFEFAGFDESAEFEFFTRLFAQDNDWWKREPATINAEIAGWVAELSNLYEADKPAPDSPLTDTASPSQQGTIAPEQVREILQEIASPQAVVANQQISFRPNAEFETPNGDLEAWLPRHLLDIIDVLRLGLRDNAPNPLKVGLAKYHEVLARDPDLPVITTLQACIGVVRITFQSDDHQIWAEGLEEPFDALFQGHERLLGDYPNLQERRRLRDQITPTPAAQKAEGLNADIARFADIAVQLKELGVTDETAHAYLQTIVDIGRQVASGSGTDAADDGGSGWTPPAQIRADMSGVMARIESQLSLLLSITGHPNVQAALVAITPEVARLLTLFG